MPRDKHLIIIGGFAGSGKTTIANKLANKLSIPKLETDFFGMFLRNEGELKNTNIDHFKIAYNLLYDLTRKILDSSGKLILDINMTRPESWNEIKKIKKERKNLNLHIIILKCPLEICAKRVEKRKKEFPDKYLINGRDVIEKKYRWEYIEKIDGKNIFLIDARRKKEDILNEVVGYLKKQHAL